jgi:hypothetical protein
MAFRGEDQSSLGTAKDGHTISCRSMMDQQDYPIGKHLSGTGRSGPKFQLYPMPLFANFYDMPGNCLKYFMREESRGK